MAIFINPYKNGSRGAKRLKEEIRKEGVKCWVIQRMPKNPLGLIVNWGNSEWNYNPPRIDHVVNEPGILGVMTNKLRFFQHVGHSKMVPEWSTEAQDALKWPGRILARQKLEASGGAGIVIHDNEDGGTDIPHAPLYVKYENKTHEYRVHVARSLRGDGFYPLLIQRKIFQKKSADDKPKSWEVRNHANGFVYVVNSGVPVPECVPTLACNFMKEHFPKLHFSALDVIFNEKRNKAFILEGNTAPGLEGNTVSVYARYLCTLHGEI